MNTVNIHNTDPQKAFQAIYDQEVDTIFRFCALRVSNREQSMDLTQETFLRLWQSMVQKKEITNPRAFLFTIVRRLIIDWYRKKKEISLESLGAQEGEDEENYDPIDEKTFDNLGFQAEGRFLLDKISKLGPSYQQAVYLRFVEDFSPPEIAEVLGISTNAASVRITRGIEELRRLTGYEIPDEDEDDEKDQKEKA